MLNQFTAGGSHTPDPNGHAQENADSALLGQIILNSEQRERVTYDGSITIVADYRTSTLD